LISRVIQIYDPGGQELPSHATINPTRNTKINVLLTITDLTIRNPVPDSNGILTYLATAMRTSLCKANPEMRLHKRMYKDATISTSTLVNLSEIEIKIYYSMLVPVTI
jgi:hypothetical protein